MSRVRMRQFSGGLTHARKPLRVAKQSAYGLDQPHFIQLCFFQHDSSACALQSLRVDSLVIVCGARERNEDGWLSRGSNFRNRARPRAAEQQVGARKERRHISDELVNLGGCARSLVRCLRVIIVALAGLMDDVYPGSLLQQIRQALNHRLIDGMRSLASSKDKQS